MIAKIQEKRPECVECDGFGYDAAENTETDKNSLLLERVGACDCADLRLGKAPGTAGDQDAWLLFVHDLENGEACARTIAARFAGEDR